MGTEPSWLIYEADGPPKGPVTTEAVVDAIMAGELTLDALIAAPGGYRWIRAGEVPRIADLLANPSTRRTPPSRLLTTPMPAVPPPSRDPMLDDDTAAQVREDTDSEPPTIRSANPRGADGFPIPPSSG